MKYTTKRRALSWSIGPKNRSLIHTTRDDKVTECGHALKGRKGVKDEPVPVSVLFRCRHCWK